MNKYNKICLHEVSEVSRCFAIILKTAVSAESLGDWRIWVLSKGQEYEGNTLPLGRTAAESKSNQENNSLRFHVGTCYTLGYKKLNKFSG